MTPQPTDADREIPVTLADFDRANAFWNLATFAKSAGMLAGQFAEVRASAYAQGRADEQANIAAAVASARKGLADIEALIAAERAAIRAAQEGASDA